jgi:hypothetical protein
MLVCISAVQNLSPKVCSPFFRNQKERYRNQQKRTMRMLKKLGESILIGLATAIKMVNTSLWSHGYQQSKTLQVMK